MKKHKSKYHLYIKNLYNDLLFNTHQQNTNDNPLYIDIVLEGGGFGGAYEIGVMMFLQHLVKKKYLIINRISGVSIGSIVGLLYLTNKLHYYDKYYSKIRNDWYNNLEMNTLSEFIRKIVYSLSDSHFENIKINKLYVSYYDLQSKQHITKSSYISKDDLFETIMKSCHMPFLKSKNLSFVDKSNNKYIDGLYPYIFSRKDNAYTQNSQKRSKILYVTINQIQKLRTCVDTRNEHDCFSRILHGILHCFDLFKYNKSNEYCSFLDEWSILDITYYRIKQVTMFIFMYLIYFLNSINCRIKPYIERNPIINTLYNIMRNYLDDIMYYFVS
jgi:hypothetical protein